MMRSAEHEAAQRATQHLVDTAYPYGDAQAEKAKAEAMLRHIKALAMKASGETAVSAQEREAYASDQYLAGIEAMFEATKKAERLKASRESAKNTVDFWRTVEASNR